MRESGGAADWGQQGWHSHTEGCRGKCVFAEGTFLWGYPSRERDVSTWALEDRVPLFPPQDVFLTAAWVALEVWLPALLSSLPSTSHRLRPQKCLSPWRSAWLAKARSLQNAPKERAPNQPFGERRWPPGLSEPVSLQPRPGPHWGREWCWWMGAPSPAAWALAGRLHWGRDRGRAGFQGCRTSGGRRRALCGPWSTSQSPEKRSIPSPACTRPGAWRPRRWTASSSPRARERRARLAAGPRLALGTAARSAPRLASPGSPLPRWLPQLAATGSRRPARRLSWLRLARERKSPEVAASSFLTPSLESGRART